MVEGVSRVERLLNLLALLLDTDQHLSRQAITQAVSGYPESEAAVRRAFERDKETLRAMGVPLDLALLDGVESAYRVIPSQYYLTDLQLDGDETAALQLAVSAVALGASRSAGEGAMLKLGATGLASTPLIAALPLVPALSALFEGCRAGAPLFFSYRGEAREVEPWGLQSARGHWYLIGFDRVRGARRTFRADRVDGEVTVGPRGTVTVPPDADLNASVHDAPWDIGGGESFRVELALDAPHHLGALEELGDEAVASALPDGRFLVTFEACNLAATRSFVLGFLEHGEVIAPVELRTNVIAWLTEIVSPPPASKPLSKPLSKPAPKPAPKPGSKPAEKRANAPAKKRGNAP